MMFIRSLKEYLFYLPSKEILEDLVMPQNLWAIIISSVQEHKWSFWEKLHLKDKDKIWSMHISAETH